MLAIYYAYYNFCRVHQSLGKRPAMIERLAREPYNLEWIVRMVEARTPPHLAAVLSANQLRPPVPGGQGWSG